jgi:hypothetical protein
MEIEKGNSRYQYPQDTILGTKGIPYAEDCPSGACECQGAIV